MSDEETDRLGQNKRKVLSLPETEALIGEFADVIVNAVCERRNPDFGAILEEMFSASALRALMSSRFGDDFALDERLIPNCEYPPLDFGGWTMEARMRRGPPAEGAVDRNQPTKRPHLDIAVDRVRELLPNYVEKKIKAKIGAALEALEAAVSADDVAQSIADRMDLSSVVNVANQDYSACWPDEVLTKFAEEIYLINSFQDWAKRRPASFLEEIDKETVRHVTLRIGSEIAGMVRNVFSQDAEKERALDEVIDSEMAHYAKDKSMVVQLLIKSYKEEIESHIKRVLGDEFFDEINLLANLDEAQLPGAVEKLIARYEASTVGKYINNFIMWIPACRGKRHPGNVRPGQFEFRREDGLLGQPLVDSEEGRELIGTVHAGKLWEAFFREVDEEFAKLKVSDEQWAGFTDSTGVNCALLPAFIAMAKKGYNVRFLRV